KPIKEAFRKPVCCTLQGEDLFLEGLQEPYRSQSKELIQSHLEHIDAFISVSEYYAEFMPTYLGIPRSKIQVVPLGINLEGYDKKRRAPSQPFNIGYFARLAPEKGLKVLAKAYARLRSSELLTVSRLHAAGYLGPEHRKYLDDILRDLKSAGLAGEFTYHGTVDREHKISFLQSLDV